MEFTGQYLTYEEYMALGGTLEKTPFNLSEYNARREIDKRTGNRLVGIGNNYQEVKLCIFNLIPTMQGYQNYLNKDKSISSEGTDGYSVSYNIPQTSYADAQRVELNNIIETSLYGLVVDGEHILYGGIRC